jgi:L-amino acid N-acyltransferase YncA
MEKQEIQLRAAAPEDAEEILGIYAYYVENTAITFEYDVPSLSEFRERIVRTLPRHPYIAAVGGGEILGYACTGPFVGRKAYDWSAETTIYLREDRRKHGLGRVLYQALEDISRAQNIINLNACIGYPEVDDEYLTQNSVQFHTHMGYVMAGRFHKCGCKFGRWYDMVWMEKLLGAHPETPLPVIPFSELEPDALAALGIGRKNAGV